MDPSGTSVGHLKATAPRYEHSLYSASSRTAHSTPTLESNIRRRHPQCLCDCTKWNLLHINDFAREISSPRWRIDNAPERASGVRVDAAVQPAAEHDPRVRARILGRRTEELDLERTRQVYMGPRGKGTPNAGCGEGGDDGEGGNDMMGGWEQ
jgi:hypothetical protein